MKKSILIADDSEAVRWALRHVLETAGFSVCAEASNGVEVLEKASELQPDVVILDVKMPKMNGIEAATVLKRRLPSTPILLLTLYDIGSAMASASGVAAVLQKPDDIKKLPEHVKKLFEPALPVNTFIVADS